ncbi:hypothetical protein SASPL_145416 [Salvia splendens]|uniref:Uncharacterized protein n=1 Tax=Salvia splendens TaxID=180675 RepID=A0A8X8Z7N1_SALSN|nr:hypothetical protein SASPL_145416 [Salvia splendens]
MDATREELPDTMAVVRLSGMEISDLTMVPVEALIVAESKDMFEAYFIEKKMLDISENINKSSINFLPLEWATSKNKEGLWCLFDEAHGDLSWQKGSEWNIGFSVRSVKIPHILRGRYCYTMILSIYNNQRSPMLQLAHDWIKANMDKFLELNNKYTKLFSRRKKK